MGAPTTEAIAATVKGHGERLTRHEGIHKDLWKSLDGVRNRLPNWATLLFAILTAALGSLGTLIGVML